MANDKTEIVIVRRPLEDEEEHHGGAWKIALADFMTAMMALFLVLWLYNVAPKETRTAIANYFNPITLSAALPTPKGLNDPETTPVGDAPGPAAPGSEAKSGQPRGGSQAPAGSPARERELFQDPYAILAKLAAEAPPNAPQDVAVGATGEPGRAGGDAVRDPFDPLYWHVVAPAPPKTERPTSGAMASLRPPGDIDARGMSAAVSPPSAAISKAEAADAVIAEPRAKAASVREDQSTPSAGQAPAVAGQAEAARRLGAQLGDLQGPRVEVVRTAEGLLISLTDDLAFSMFAVGSAEPQPRTVRAMEAVAHALAGRPGRIVIRGHTDGRPFRSDTYDNWRLSTARAHMAAYMLMRVGIAEARIRRIEGYASGVPRNVTDPKAAENRRVEILLEEAPR
ncbi:MotB family protein [Methylobacterium sp. 1030]|uniref:MotB family protein n=1 Tax=Methylobacterium sp. 1030 TaxID=3156404 RepID=UPI00339306C6